MSNYFFLHDKYVKCAPNRKIKSEDDTCFSIDILEDMLNTLTEHIKKNNIFSDNIKIQLKKALEVLLTYKDKYIYDNSEDNIFLYKIRLYRSVKKILKYYTKKIPLKDNELNDIDFNNDFNWLKLPIFEHLFYKYNIHDIFNLYNVNYIKYEGVNSQYYDVVMDKYEQLYPEFKYIIIKCNNNIVKFNNGYNNYDDIKYLLSYLKYCHTKLNRYKFGFLISNSNEQHEIAHIVALYMDLHKLQLYYQNSWGIPPNQLNTYQKTFYFINDIINQLYRFMMSFYTNYNKLYNYLNDNNNSIEKLNDHYKNLINTIIKQNILIYLIKTLHENYTTYKRQYEEYKLSEENVNLDILKTFVTNYKNNQNFFNDDNIKKLNEIKEHIKIQLNNIIDEINKRKYIRQYENNFLKMDKKKYINNCIEKIYEQMVSLSPNGDTIDKDDKKEIFNDNMQIINKFFDIRYNNRKVQSKYGICTLFAITFIARLVEGYSFDNFINIHETEDDMLHYLNKYLNSF